MGCANTGTARSKGTIASNNVIKFLIILMYYKRITHHAGATVWYGVGQTDSEPIKNSCINDT